MKKFIALIITILLLSSCTTDKGVNNETSNSIEEKETQKEQETQETEQKEVDVIELPKDVEEEIKVNPLDDIDLTVKPNELGQIMILMYHSIGDEESEWTRSSDNFRNDLEYLYENGYRALNLKDFATGNIKVESGYTPFVITFDDGNKNNFNMIEKDGENIIDPNCAVGILEEFKKKYLDFKLTATFYIYGTNPFRQPEFLDYKLKFLIENGYDIGNHTYGHKDLTDTEPEEIKYQLGKLSQFVKEKVENYEVNTLALPYGAKPNDEYYDYLVKGVYDDIEYNNIAILKVGWSPSTSPFDIRTDFTALQRIRASETNVDNVGMYNWLDYFEKHPDRKFISDGNPDIITVPKVKEEFIDENKILNKMLYLYE